MIKLFEENERLHKKASEILKALGEIKKSQNFILKNATESEKIQEFADKLAASTLKNIKHEKAPNEKLRFIDAITPEGHTVFENSIKKYEAKNIYIIEDKHEIISSQILQKIRSEALGRNIDIVSFPHPMSPEKHLRAIYLPEVSAVFAMKNPKTEPNLFKNLKNAKKISATKFLKLATLKPHKNLLGLYEKISAELLNQITENLSLALKNHDKIEETYISAMNHKKVNKIADKLISAIFVKS